MRDRLAAFAAEALPPGEQARVGAHLAGCPECRAQLSGLERALGVLNRARPTAAVDAWPVFAQRRAAGECPAFAPLLPAYAANELPTAVSARITEHLSLCPACSGEAAGLNAALGSFQPATHAPDLWSAMAARLAAEVSCNAVVEGLPAYLSGDSGGRQGRTVALHLEACPSCAAEAAAYAIATRTLDRVGAAPVEVDLWPAFAARLAAAERRSWATRLAALAPLRRSPAWRPAMGFAAVLLLVTLAPLLTARHQGAPLAPQVALIAAPIAPLGQVGAGERPDPVAAAPEAIGRRAARLRPQRRYALPGPRFRRMPAARQVSPAIAAAAVLTPAAPEAWGGLKVAFNPDLPVPAVRQTSFEAPAPEENMSGAAATAFKQDFVMFASVIEEIRDATASPLEAGHD